MHRDAFSRCVVLARSCGSRPARRPSHALVARPSGNRGRGRGTAVDGATGGPENLPAMNTIAGILVIAWIAIALVNTVSAWRYTWGLPLTEIPGTTPPAAVVVAVKNASDGLVTPIRACGPAGGQVARGMK